MFRNLLSYMMMKNEIRVKLLAGNNYQIRSLYQFSSSKSVSYFHSRHESKERFSVEINLGVSMKF